MPGALNSAAQCSAIRRTIATLGKTKGHVKDIQGMMRHSKASTTTDVYMQSLEPEVRTAINSIYAELVGTGTTGPTPERPATFGTNAAGREADHGVFTQPRSSTIEPKNGSGREENQTTAVPSRGKILQFAGKIWAKLKPSGQRADRVESARVVLFEDYYVRIRWRVAGSIPYRSVCSEGTGAPLHQSKMQSYGSGFPPQPAGRQNA